MPYPAHPPLVKDTTHYYGGAEKAELLASHFEERLCAKPGHPRRGAHQKYLEDICRGTPTTPLEVVSILEIRKAIDSLSARKAPGPDGLPTEVFKNLPSPQGPLALLFTSILQKGRIPKDMLSLYIAPLDKSGKPRTDCGAKRPVSLLCTISKLLEAVVYHRLLPHIEPHL